MKVSGVQKQHDFQNIFHRQSHICLERNEGEQMTVFPQFTKWMWNPPIPHVQCTRSRRYGEGTFGYCVGNWNWFKTSGAKKNYREWPQSSNTVL